MMGLHPAMFISVSNSTNSTELELYQVRTDVTHVTATEITQGQGRDISTLRFTYDNTLNGLESFTVFLVALLTVTCPLYCEMYTVYKALKQCHTYTNATEFATNRRPPTDHCTHGGHLRFFHTPSIRPRFSHRPPPYGKF